MNNPEQTNNPADIITSAEQLVASLWQAEKDEETPPIAPPGSEALEDEIKAMQAAIDADLARQTAEQDAADMELHCRILDVDRFSGADVPSWGVGCCVEGHCGNADCKRLHHTQKRFMVTKRADGSYAVMQYEEIYNVREQHKECTEPSFGGAIRINLDEIIEQTMRDVVSKKVKEAVQGGDDEDEDLPPAAIVEESTPDEEVLRQLKAFLEGPVSAEDKQRLKRVWEGVEQQRTAEDGEDTATIPVMNIEEYRRVKPAKNTLWTRLCRRLGRQREP